MDQVAAQGEAVDLHLPFYLTRLPEEEEEEEEEEAGTLGKVKKGTGEMASLPGD